MRQCLFFLLINFLCIACSTDEIKNPENLKILTVKDIIAEYAIADSLNHAENRSQQDTSTVILGLDERNYQIVIRKCLNRGSGCMLFADYYTILYQNCDSICCERNGNWMVDYVGFAGARSPVGCEPDTVSEN